MGVNMDLKQLRYFIEVAEREHISQAALELEVAQSAISRQMANLEQELGTPLFIREGRNIKLTAEGETLLSRARHLVHYMKETKEVISQQVEQQDNQIYLGYNECYLSHTLTSITRNFHQQFDIPLISIIDEDELLFQQLKNRQLDLLITGQYNLDASISQIPLYEEYFYLLIQSKHNMAMTQQPSFQQLKQLKLFIPKSYSHTIQSLLRNEAMPDFHHFSSFDYADYILTNENYALIIPDYMAGTIKQEKITKISLSHLFKRNITLYYQPSNPKKQLQQTIQHLMKYLQKTTTYH